MTLNRRHLLAMLAACLAQAAAQSAFADRRGGRRRGHDDDYDDHDDHDDRGQRDAVKALKSGDVLPLREILDEVRKMQPGEIVGIEFERKKERWVYEIKMVTPDNRYLEIYMDARTKEIVKIEGK